MSSTIPGHVYKSVEHAADGRKLNRGPQRARDSSYLLLSEYIRRGGVRELAEPCAGTRIPLILQGTSRC